MSDTLVPQPAGPTDAFDQQPPLTQAQRVGNMFFAPTKTFADIRRNTSWWLPFVLLSIFGLVFSATVLTRVGQTRLAETSIRTNPRQNEKLQNAKPEERAQMVRITAVVMKFVLWTLPVTQIIFYAIGALLLWVGFNFILGGTGTYSGMFAVAVFSAVPTILRTILTIVVLFTGDSDTFNLNDPIGTNPGFYMGADSSPFLKALLSSVDLFTLWVLLLMAVGGAIVARVKPSKGVVMVFVVWLLFALGKATIAAIS